MTRGDVESGPPLVEALTPREREILSHLAHRHTNREIADRLVLSLNTVKWYARQIYGKLGVGNRREAAVRARELGLLPTGDSAPVAAHNLPSQLTPLLGRRETLDHIARSLAGGARLVTVVGPGGVGKTRVAIAVAATMLDTHAALFPDGAFFVPLAGVAGSHMIPAAIARAIGLDYSPGSENPVQQLLHALSNKRLLLVLDNIEHLIDDRGVRHVVDILAAAQGVHVLVTSRTRLNVQGEHLIPLAGLAIPDADKMRGAADPVEQAGAFAAIQLFLHSARRLRPGFALDAHSLTPVVRICRLVVGLPLAIELAASWVTVLEPPAIAVELEQSLDILETDARNVPERQQSLRAVFDASWRLLSATEREAVQALSIFQGGFDREGARGAGRVGLGTLASLVNKSWVEQIAGGRFQMHDLLCRYARDRLARDPAHEAEVCDRHSAYYCGWLSRQEEGTWGPRQEEVLVAIEADEGNVRAACLWAAAHARIARLSGAVQALGLFYYQWRRNYQMAAALFRDLACATAAVDGPALATAPARYCTAKLLAWQATFSGLIGDLDATARLIEESEALLGGQALDGVDTRLPRAHNAWQLGYLYLYPDPERASRHFAESLRLYCEIDYPFGVAGAELGLGRALRGLDAFEEANEALDASLAQFEKMGNQHGTREALTTLAAVALRRARFDEAERLIERSLSICCEADRAAVALALGFRAAVRFQTGRFGEAEDAMTECLALTDDLGMSLYAIYWRFTLGRIYLHAGKYGAARRLGEQMASRARDLGDESGSAMAAALLGHVDLVEGDPAAARARFEQAEGGMTADTTGGHGSARLALIGLATLGAGDRSEARRYFQSALDHGHHAPEFVGLLTALAASALLAASEGDVERAVELYAWARRYPLVANSRWFDDAIGRHVDAAAASLPQEVVDAARARGQARDLGDGVSIAW